MWQHRYLEPGERYGRWTVVRYSGLRRTSAGGRNSLRCYLCRCDCGTERVVIGSTLTRGLSRSCGCLRREAAEEARRRKRAAALARVARQPKPYVPEHPEEFNDDWMFCDVTLHSKKL